MRESLLAPLLDSIQEHTHRNLTPGLTCVLPIYYVNSWAIIFLSFFSLFVFSIVIGLAEQHIPIQLQKQKGISTILWNRQEWKDRSNFFNQHNQKYHTSLCLGPFRNWAKQHIVKRKRAKCEFNCVFMHFSVLCILWWLL